MPMPDRVCSECGSDRYVARDAQRTYEAADRMRRASEKVAQDNGLLRFKLDVEQSAHRDTQSRLQRKITRQARVIRRMEDRLRALNQKPYEGMGRDTAPGAEYDAAQPDA